MSPLLYQLSYTARKDGTQSGQDTGMVWRVSSLHYSRRESPCERAGCSGLFDLSCLFG